MKNPSSITYSKVFPRGGRVNNLYQNIVNRRVPLSSSTTINRNPIAEPDFTANHLWMFSYLIGEELPNDPYKEIEDITDCSRQQVKMVCTTLLGALRLQQRGGLIKNSTDMNVSCSATQFKSIEAAFIQQYPWIESHSCFYSDRGAWLQNLEGQIALRMMGWAVEKKMPLLAVHDAFAVESHNEAITFEKMHEFRLDVLKEAKSDNFLTKSSALSHIVLKKKDEVAAKKKADKAKQRVTRNIDDHSLEPMTKDYDDDFNLDDAL